MFDHNGVKNKYTSHLFSFPQLGDQMVVLSAILAKQSQLLHPDPDIKAYE